MQAVSVIGAGNSGLAMAVHLVREGECVRLWNRSKERLHAVANNGGIDARGVFHGKYLPALLTDNIAEAVRGARIILITVPANAHLDVVSSLAPYLTAGQIILLNPGRTFGALVCHREIQRLTGTQVIVAETQTIVYTCRKAADTNVTVISVKNNVPLAALDPKRTQSVLNSLPICLRSQFSPAPNTLYTSLGNVGMILHCAPMLFNTGWVESTRTQFKYYYEGITPTVASFLEDLDRERLAVARRCGIRLPSTAGWMKQVYGVQGKDLYTCIQANRSYARIEAPDSMRHRYLSEDVPSGLVPLEALGFALGVPMRLTGILIDLASHMLKCDLRACGRNAKALGITPKMRIKDLIGTVIPGFD